ncbi:hypothetical protein ACYCAX_00595 [Pseudomonas sp. MT3]
MPGSIAKVVASRSLLAEGFCATADTANVGNPLPGHAGNLRAPATSDNHPPPKNDKAAAVPNAQHAHAAGSATPSSTCTLTVNDASTKTGPLPAGMTFAVDGDDSGIAQRNDDAYLDTWSASLRTEGSDTGHADSQTRTPRVIPAAPPSTTQASTG